MKSALTFRIPRSSCWQEHLKDEGGYGARSSQNVGYNFNYKGNNCKSFAGPANTQHLPKTIGKLARQWAGGGGGVTQF